MTKTEKYNIDLLFVNLLKQALDEFPEELLLVKTDQYGNFIDDSICEGIFDLKQELASKYFDKWNEILIANLLDAIFIVLRKLSLITKKIKLSDIREDAIKITYDKILRDTLIIADLGWTEDDKALVKKYFEMNEA